MGCGMHDPIPDLIQRANRSDTLDDAVALIQRELGVTDGRIAAAAFSDINNDDFRSMWKRERLGRLRAYAQSEINSKTIGG